MVNDRESQPYSYTPTSSAGGGVERSAAEQVAYRAALLKRMLDPKNRSGATGGGGGTSAAATGAMAGGRRSYDGMPANVAAATAAAAAMAAATVGKPPSSTTAASSSAAAQQPRAAAEDAVQDGGDAIDTFSSYVPTALPSCIVRALREKAMASCAVKASSEISAVVATAREGAMTGNDKANEMVDLIGNDNGIAVSSTSKSNNEDDVIEILDTDNEDSHMEILDGNNTAKSSNDTTIDESNSTDTNNDRPNMSSNDTLPPLFTNTSTIQSHTSPAVESALLSSVSAPPVPDAAADAILPLVKEGKLSPLQAEGVTLAIHRFQRVFTSKGSGKGDGRMRAGFFIGDGAGIGKGRQISATILDATSRNHGRGRHLWISVSRELVQDARRDLSDVGCHVNVHDGAEVLDQMGGNKKGKGLGAGGSLGKGVLFVTYSLLVSGKRMEDMIGWLSGSSSSSSGVDNTKGSMDRVQERMEQSYDGVIVFDEAHKAKNLEADTRTAKLVIALQERLPNARVLYCSATGVSDIKHMVYATRLGLWGSANPLYPTFDSFQGALAKRGVGAMEMLALEMKRKGIFLARTLSWDGAEFHTLEVKLSKEQIGRYNGAVQWWFNVKDQMKAALDLMNITAPKMMWRTYWSAHQRFFKEMCICSKIDEVAAQAKKYLENGDHSIVIGLQSTGEAGMEVALEELAESAAERAGKKVKRTDSGKIDFEDMTFSGLVSTCASIMMNFVRNHFPVALPPPEVPKVPSIPPNGFASEGDRLEHMRLLDLVERIRNEPPPEPIPELVERRDALLESIKDLDLPPNPLDDIIDRFGGVDNVAEMTGRSGRILRNKSGKYKYVRRFGGPSKQKSYGLSMPVSREDENDRLNIVEKRKFMEGKKSVAIISDAASTGISLHADRRCNSSQKRRVHFTIELPWAADKAIQQLGRSHRSGQVSAPIYKMVVTELGGERRFASAVSKRMAQLGALTKGDRRAATGTDLSDFDIDSIFGRRALTRTYAALSEQPISAPSRNSNGVLDNFVTTEGVGEGLTHKDEESKRAFALEEASGALIDAGLEGEPNVKQFLNRIAGLDVARQNLVFSLFMTTLDDVITDAKATGEFEGSVEDIRATRVALKTSPEVIATDSSCGAKTELTRLVIDRGISFNDMVQTIIDSEESASDKKSIDADDKKQETDRKDEQKGCESGFYLSRRAIAGRRLILFAEKKVKKEDGGIDTDFIDPLNLMVVTRSNTGKNPCEMSSRELNHKYKLLLSSQEMLKHLHTFKEELSLESDGEQKCGKDTTQPMDAISIVRSQWGSTVSDLWDDAYNNSNFKYHNDGLAPRISEIGLVTGAVLHILPSLEKAVQFMPQSQRSLRVMRVELSDSGQRIVGIKFPVTEDAIVRLMAGMEEVASARQGSLGSPSYLDDPFSSIDQKALSRATTEKKTMKSFFNAATSKENNKSKSDRNNLSSSGVGSKLGTNQKDSQFVSPPPLKMMEKKQKSISSKGPAKKKAKTTNISSFFQKKNNNL